MGFELGTGFLTMIDRDTGEQFDLGEVTPLEMEVEECPASIISYSDSFIF